MTHLFIHFLVAAMLVVTGVTANNNDEKPKVSICPSAASDEEHHEEVRISKLRASLRELVDNDRMVMSSFDVFAKELSNALFKEKSISEEEIEPICRAITFAAEKHKGQQRKNKEKTQYITHPLGVTYNLMHYGEVRNEKIVIAALLHDVLNQKACTIGELEQAFGKQVADYVKEVTDDKSPSRSALRRAQLIKAPKISEEAAQIKLADYLFNLMDLSNHPPETWSQGRIDRYYQWIQSLIDRLPPAANKKLKDAVQQTIDQYWEQQTKSERPAATR
jgi:guanosine-3',5'-bis(diphosphate) 3'-pyrophosphohydrolase